MSKISPKHLSLAAPLALALAACVPPEPPPRPGVDRGYVAGGGVIDPDGYDDGYSYDDGYAYGEAYRGPAYPPPASYYPPAYYYGYPYWYGPGYYYPYYYGPGGTIIYYDYNGHPYTHGDRKGDWQRSYERNQRNQTERDNRWQPRDRAAPPQSPPPATDDRGRRDGPRILPKPEASPRPAPQTPAPARPNTRDWKDRRD